MRTRQRNRLRNRPAYTLTVQPGRAEYATSVVANWLVNDPVYRSKAREAYTSGDPEDLRCYIEAALRLTVTSYLASTVRNQLAPADYDRIHWPTVAAALTAPTRAEWATEQVTAWILSARGFHRSEADRYAEANDFLGLRNHIHTALRFAGFYHPQRALGRELTDTDFGRIDWCAIGRALTADRLALPR
ncbi:hypothetical protein ACFXG4_30500 [Nocardia sp. NPDC059246]|uniref:hypothetical protein n=1 Tax=unclassified Nocardia TaxID=2637762 RepID=UPI0036BFFCDB